MKAFVFDLFGTLVDNYRVTEFQALANEMANCLNISSEEFSIHWFRTTARQRMNGYFKSVFENLEFICLLCHRAPNPAAIESAVKINYTYTHKSLLPRQDALLTLSSLRKAGYKLGLISDCPPDVPLIWPSTPFYSLIEAPIFSCKVGMKKPQREIYALSAALLEVATEDCWYVGDGSSYELDGAYNAGMTPILIRTIYENPYELGLLESLGWAGLTINNLTQLLDRW